MSLRELLATAVLALILMAVAVIWFAHEFSMSVAEVTDSSRYPQILNKLRSEVSNPTVTLANFPPTIPPNATNVRFFYRPQFLQGDTELQLRITLPATQVNQIAAATTAATRPTTMPSISGLVNFRDATNTGWAELPPDFQNFVLGTRTQPNEAEMEYAYGIAVSQTRNEVIYWLEN
jgi:hypothetical protein